LVTRKELREIKGRFNADKRGDDVRFLQREFKTLTIAAHMEPDLMPKDPKDVLDALAVPEDYKKIVRHIGICDPKTRRIAHHCVDMWSRINSGEYMQILRVSFFDENGRLRPDSLDKMFADFHAALLHKVQELEDFRKEWKQLEKKYRVTQSK